jgi:hypothetical protein
VAKALLKIDVGNANGAKLLLQRRLDDVVHINAEGFERFRCVDRTYMSERV